MASDPNFSGLWFFRPRTARVYMSKLVMWGLRGVKHWDREKVRLGRTLARNFEEYFVLRKCRALKTKTKWQLAVVFSRINAKVPKTAQSGKSSSTHYFRISWRLIFKFIFFSQELKFLAESAFRKSVKLADVLIIWKFPRMPKNSNKNAPCCQSKARVIGKITVRTENCGNFTMRKCQGGTSCGARRGEMKGELKSGLKLQQ